MSPILIFISAFARTHHNRGDHMVKKLKALAESANDTDFAQTVRESAHQIWLAGLGAFAKTQAEGAKMFEGLVQEGRTVETRTRKLAESKMTQMSASVGKAAKQATATWDKLEQVFEDRVARALHRLGVPTSKDIQALAKRVETLNDSVQKLAGGATKARRQPAARRAAGNSERKAKSSAS
jgi:poly(hydroxyalkanoate) granule-associated protein